MTPVEALKIGRDALAEAMETHIYNTDNGEKPDAHCRYAQVLADMDKVIAAATPKPVDRYPSPHWRDHLAPTMRECIAFEYYEIRPCIEHHGSIQSFSLESSFHQMITALRQEDVPHRAFWTLYGRYDQGEREMLATAIGDFMTKEDAFAAMNAILAIPAAASDMIRGCRNSKAHLSGTRAANLLEDMINQSSNYERL